jgi:hypothetical protein
VLFVLRVFSISTSEAAIVIDFAIIGLRYVIASFLLLAGIGKLLNLRPFQGTLRLILPNPFYSLPFAASIAFTEIIVGLSLAVKPLKFTYGVCGFLFLMFSVVSFVFAARLKGEKCNCFGVFAGTKAGGFSQAIINLAIALYLGAAAFA